MISTPTRSKASSSNLPTSQPEANAPTAPASTLPDLLAGLRWGTRELTIAATALLVLDLFAGWTYLASYFGYFRIPVESLELSLPEVLAQGLRTVLFPMTVIVVAAVAPTRRLRQAATAVGAYLAVLAVIALVSSWASAGAVAVQLAAAIVAGATMFGLRLGVGRKPTERLAIGAAAILLLVSIPVALGTLDGARTAGTKSTTMRLATSGPVLPSAVPTGGGYEYTNYVLLRENSSRYWIFRIGDRFAYSIPKSEVLYIRY